jgi:hypothetical protein
MHYASYRTVAVRYGNYLHHQTNVGKWLKKLNVLFVRIIFMHIDNVRSSNGLEEGSVQKYLANQKFSTQVRTVSKNNLLLL